MREAAQVGGLEEGAPVCLGVQRPRPTFNFEQTALIQRKAAPAGHKPVSPAMARADRHLQPGLTSGLPRLVEEAMRRIRRSRIS